MNEKFEHKEGKGNIMPNHKEDEKHDYYGSLRVSRDVKAGETIKFQGYKNVAKTILILNILDCKCWINLCDRFIQSSYRSS